MKNIKRIEKFYFLLIAIILIILVLVISSGQDNEKSTIYDPTSSNTTLAQQTPTSSIKLFQPGIEGTLTGNQQTGYQRLSSKSVTQPWIRSDNGVIRFSVLNYQIPDSLGITPEEKANIFLDEYKDLFSIEADNNEFVFTQQKINSDGSYVLIYLQKINDIPVYGANIVVNISKSGIVTSINGGYIPGYISYNPPIIDSAQTLGLVQKEFNIGLSNISPQMSLVYLDETVFGETVSNPKLAWKLVILDDEGNINNYLFVDTTSGSFLLEIPTILNYEINVYDNQQNSYKKLSKAILVSNSSGCIIGQNCDQDSQDAYKFSKEYEEFIWNNYHPQGFDTDFESIKAYTHATIPANILCNIPKGQSNAFWDNDSQAIIFTDGMSHGNDVIFHELTHRLISNSLALNNTSGSCDGLCYQGQSGALSESFSDIFGVLIDNGDTNSSWKSQNWLILDWGIGEDTPLGIIRNISNDPPAYQDAKSYNCRNDYGYVHQNSLIPSKAAHLLLQSTTSTINNYSIQGIGPNKVSQIYYRAITNHINQNDNFRDVRDAIVLSCYELIGYFDIKQDDCVQVVNAFAAVGIGLPASVIPTPVNTLSPKAVPTISFSGVSSTVLVFDTSGSMGEYDTSGQEKIEAAKKAGVQILNMVSAENSAQNTANQIAIAGYSTQAYVVSPLTSDISTLFSSIETLTPTNRTAMADGLKAGLDLFGSDPNKKILILLSDGLPNIGLNTIDLQDIAVIKQQVLDLATQAGQNGICVYTVGFGDPAAGIGSIDEGFLTEVANASGCGTYYNALDAISLANVYVELRHASTGSVIYKQSGQISQGQNLDLGQIEVPANQELLLFTLNWPGSRLEAVLKDPSGTIVNTSYSGASISETSTLLSIILDNPVEGSWSLGVNGVDVPEGTTVYNTIISTRAGAVVTPEVKGGSFPFIFLVIILAGSAMGVYVYSNSIKRAGKGSTLKPLKGGRLIGLDGELTNQSIPLLDGLIIGRGSGASLRINDSSVSRAHARIRYAQGSWFIQDLDSKGGVFINGNKVNASRLSNGDKLQIGSQSFTFIDEKK